MHVRMYGSPSLYAVDAFKKDGRRKRNRTRQLPAESRIQYSAHNVVTRLTEEPHMN